MHNLSLSKTMAVLMTTAMTVVGMCPLYAAASQTSTSDEAYKYVYAGLSWAEYWKSEGVYLSGSDLEASSDEMDAHEEKDKGAFDVVTRATANHGLHRGSFQCNAVIYDTSGETYEVSHWTSRSDAVLTNGKTITFSRGEITKEDGSAATMDHYEVTGIKYVPVKVSAEDYADFCTKYDVVEDGTLSGGYGEINLVAYGLDASTAPVAAVTDDTNGLKTAVKEADGTYSFTKRETGADSGIKDTEQKKASDIIVTVKPGSGSYGEFLRVDLTGDGYGALGSNMQTVRWDYYGTDAKQSTPLASYGTKFAADNWMHKSNGIQLGLTDSLRCHLPDGTDGTGRWVLTVYALGYEDYSFEIDVNASNLAEGEEATEESITALQNAIDSAKNFNQADYTEKTWNDLQTELAEAEAEIKALHSEASVKEALEHLSAAIAALEKVSKDNTDTNNGTNQTGNTNNTGDTGNTKTVVNDAQHQTTDVKAPGKVKKVSVKNKKGRKALIRWKKASGAEGYVIYRSTKRKGTYKAVKTIKSVKKLKYVNTKLKKGKTYYYKVCAYKTVNGEKVFGAYSAVRKVTVKK